MFKTKMRKWLLVPVTLLMMAALLVGGCNGDDGGNGGNDGNGGNGGNGGDTPDNGAITGTIDEAGSTSVQPLAELMAFEFMDMYPDVTINISGGGSSAGVKACAAGTVDIGAASRDVKMSEADLIPIPIARDAVAIVVNEANPISELSMKQVAGIYAGDLTNWSDVGGNDAEIVVVSREEGSGTRDCFESKLMDAYDKEIKADALFYDSNGAARTKVSSEADAIGFVSLGYVEGLKTIVIDGVEPTLENCQSGDYPVLRRLYLLSQDVPTGATKAFIDFCRSAEGQAIAAESWVPLVKTETPFANYETFVEIVGTIDEAGSTSVQPLAELMAFEFMDKYPDVTINISGGGSSAGVKACDSGTVDMGAASRDIKMSEADLIAIPIARDAVAIVVNADNPISELTMEQVAGIYAGDITNWSDVGGNDAEIIVVSREEGSGTRDCFESKLMDAYDKEIKADALFYDSNGAARTKVSSESNAIGFVSLGYVEGLKTIVIDGVEPTLENCQSGDYPVLRRLYLLTQEVPTGAVAAFIDFCRSAEGQAIAAESWVPLVD
ncbi:MAG: phosphate ABC transporter substrate-binding protein [Dehalococcoidia bacterium]